MSPDYLLSARAAVIGAIALIALIGVAGLTYAKNRSWPSAGLAGLAAFGAAVVGLHAIVGP